MNLLPLQILLLVAFGLGLFFLWRAAEPSERWLRWIVAAGFLIRAIAGQMLFWISWLRLPILRSLQTPDGYWLFAQDASFYFPQAVAAAEKGLRAIAFYDRGSASVTYVQLLACTIWLLGRPASVGILLNLFCYLGTVALLVRWSRVEPRTRTAVAVAIVAISLTPALVLWSVQPLKDSLFQLLFVAFVVACAMWQRAWLSTKVSWRTRIVIGAQMTIVLFLLAGIRWYFAGALVAAASVFLLIVAFSAAERKTISFAAAAMMIVVLTQSLVLSAERYMPPELVALLTMKSTRASLTRVPQSMFATIERTRRGFDTTPASTMIRSGRRLTSAAATPQPAVVPPQPPPMPAPRAQLAEEDAATIRALLHQQAAAWKRSDVARAMDSYWRSPQLEIVDGTTVVRGWEQAVEAQRRGRGAVSSLRMTVLQIAGAGDTATVSGRWDVTTLAGNRETQMFTMTLRRFPDGEWRIVREVFPSSLPPPAPVAVVRAAPPPPAPPRVQRLLVGTAALTVPRVLGERLGLFDIGGGRGLLWFTEIDTVIFDLALLFALWTVFARDASTWRNPLMWLVLLTATIVGAPLVYSISNFGTLFRLREMIYLGLLLITIAARDRPLSKNLHMPEATGEHTNMTPKNTICLWFDKDAVDAARFYAATFPDSAVTAVHKAPADYPGGKAGDALTVEFTVLGIPCLGLNGGPTFKHSEAFSFQVATDDQEETDRYWNAIVNNGGQESQCGWCKDRWGLSWQITPRVLTDALAAGGDEAKRAFEAMMPMKKIDIATIEAARRG